jgi:hypothetical protein
MTSLYILWKLVDLNLNGFELAFTHTFWRNIDEKTSSLCGVADWVNQPGFCRSKHQR